MPKIEIVSGDGTEVTITNYTFKDCNKTTRRVYLRELLKDHLCEKLCNTYAEKIEIAKIIDEIPLDIMYSLTQTAQKYALCKFIYNKIKYHPEKGYNIQFSEEEYFTFDYLYKIIHDCIRTNYMLIDDNYGV